MPRPRRTRDVPLRYDDGVRGGVAMLAGVPFAVVAVAVAGASPDLERDLAGVLVWLCGAFVAFFGVHIVWTHRAFARTAAPELSRIAALQQRRGAGTLARILGLGSAEEWGVSAGTAALVVSIAAAVAGAGRGGLVLALLVLLTVGAAWTSVVYAFALRYLRLDAAGETISFDIVEEPTFSDFLSMAVMVSSVGALSAGTPRTRAGLSAVRTHTFIAFAFNTLVVAMVVSIITTLVTAG